MRTLLLAILITGCLGYSYAQDHPEAPPAEKRTAHMKRPDIFAKLKLTDEQKTQLKDLKYETMKKEIDLRSKLALSKLELGRLVSAEEPDNEAIQKKIAEVAANKTALAVNKLNGWFEANKKLAPDQQKIWREELRTTVMERMEHEGGQEMNHFRRE
jgi:Spy/CpxP family protein refolding chaperone